MPDVAGERGSPEGQPRPDAGPAAAPTPKTTDLAQAIGGGRGLLDSALPATVFVVVRLVTGELNPAILTALGVGIALVVLRRMRGEPLQQAGSGFFGLAIAVAFARFTGTGEGFFLPGIVITGGMGVAFLVSLGLGRPAVALALAAYDERYARWREHPPLRQACVIATAVWAVTFFIRAGFAGYLYSLEGDKPGTLLVAIQVVKWPLILGAALLTVILVRRAGAPAEPHDAVSGS